MLLLQVPRAYCCHSFCLNLFYSFCENKNKALDDADAPDPRFLTDDDLKAALLKHGITVGPIVGEEETRILNKRKILFLMSSFNKLSVLASTRALYEKKLRRLLRSGREENVNGERENELYSDTEEEEESTIKCCSFSCMYELRLLLLSYNLVFSLTFAGSEATEDEKIIKRPVRSQQQSSQVRFKLNRVSIYNGLRIIRNEGAYTIYLFSST